jgi:cytoskeletal protein RodZ
MDYLLSPDVPYIILRYIVIVGLTGLAIWFFQRFVKPNVETEQEKQPEQERLQGNKPTSNRPQAK